MFRKIIFSLLSIFGYFNFISAITMGPYKIEVEKVEACPLGSKPQQHSTTEFDLRDGILFENITIHQDVGPLMGKTRLFVFKDGRFLPTLSMDQENLCKLPFPFKAMKLTFDVDFNNCFIKKGNYVNYINLTETSQEMIGQKFFYSRFKMVSEWYTKKYRVLCSIAIAELKPV